MHNDSRSTSWMLMAALAVGCNSDELAGQSGSGFSAGESGATDTASNSNSDGDSDSAEGTGGEEGSNSDSVSGTTGPGGASASASASDSDATTNMGGEEGSDTDSDSDTNGDCPAEDPLCDIPDDELLPVDVPSGLPRPDPGVYDDPQDAPDDHEFRALFGLTIRDPGGLADSLEHMANPNDPMFGQHMPVATWMDTHAPTAHDLQLVRTWLTTRGFTIDFSATNRLLVQFSGTVAQFNATFGVDLKICMRENPHAGQQPYPVYCADIDTIAIPTFIADRANGVVSADLPAELGDLPGEAGEVTHDPPGDDYYTPHQIAVAYGLQPLYEAGFTGQGVKLGVIAAATYQSKDLQTFWKSFDVTRELPTRIQVMEPVITRITETIRDVQWATVMAPGAEVVVYEGPDARNTALLYTFNEAIARAEVDVLTDSFDHREDSEPLPLLRQYDEAAMMGAALGITIVGASGNSAKPDIPCSSPHVTCVGGTDLDANKDGEVQSERAWDMSGSGDTLTFPRPYWQQNITQQDTRAVCDVALNASEQHPYWLLRYGEWVPTHGTSVAAPVFAAIVAVIDSARLADGKRRVGYFNPALYLDADVHGSFRDITEGQTEYFEAGEGWDYPTGWGAPVAHALAESLP